MNISWKRLRLVYSWWNLNVITHKFQSSVTCSCYQHIMTPQPKLSWRTCALESWLVSVGYSVFFCPDPHEHNHHCHHQLQATASRHGGGVTSAASHTATIATMINGLSNAVMSSLSWEVVTMPPYTKDVRALDGSSPRSSSCLIFPPPRIL